LLLPAFAGLCEVILAVGTVKAHVHNSYGKLDVRGRTLAIARARDLGLVLGFAGAGGKRAGNVVRYTVVSRFLQSTTFGELDGSATPRVKEIMPIFRDAGFPVARTPNMDA
jgi:ketopantoate reductase